jgi:hypothetical protein
MLEESRVEAVALREPNISTTLLHEYLHEAFAPRLMRLEGLEWRRAVAWGSQP